MASIRILPEILTNQIAAGEVVERPASVVKELVENSLDAGATRIVVEVEKGGKSLIRVSDNGCGLSRDDALLSIERYATSKIFDHQDLFSISTMGFRGEALPSIASVSRFMMVTKTTDAAVGTRIEMAGGKLVNVEDTGAPAGTYIEVKHLFYNTPARKKFLKSDQTETGHIADMISGLALSFPDVQFKLISNHRIHKNFAAVHDPFQRTVLILGKETAKKLYAIDHFHDDLKIHGFCAHPSLARSSSARIFLFVNHRLVNDRGLVSAVLKAYQGRLMKGQYPMVVLFIDIAFDQVDVNVHPSKKEVKFYNYAHVYQMVTQGIEKALISAQSRVEEYTARVRSRSNDDRQKPAESAFITGGRAARPAVDPAESDPVAADQAVFDWPIRPDRQPGTRQEASAELKTFDSGSADPGPDEVREAPVRRISESPPGPGRLSDAVIIGQVMDSYILIELKNRLIMMDQHAAHERVVYEQLKKRYNALDRAGQQLLVPETLELSYREAAVLTDILTDMTVMGFDIQPFGETTFVIRAIPPIIREREARPLILEIIEKTVAEKQPFSQGRWLEACLILAACHGAIRANQKMNEREIRQLLSDLEVCSNPMHCPHGRPTMISWGQPEIEKLFKRVV